jgi:apolipoprotein N-acyltransferase
MIKKYINQYTKLLACFTSANLVICANQFFPNLIWIALVPFIFVSRNLTNKKSFFLGCLTGTLIFAGMSPWMYKSILVYSTSNYIAASLLLLATITVHGVHWGVILFFANFIRKKYHRIPYTLLIPTLFTSVEFLLPLPMRPYLYHYQAKNHLLIQIADLTGPFGVTFIITFVNALFAGYISSWFFKTHTKAPMLKLAGGGLLILFVIVYGNSRINEMKERRDKSPKIKIGVIQSNIDPIKKTDHTHGLFYLRSLQEITKQVVNKGVELVLWPEGTYSFPMEYDFSEDYPNGHHAKIMNGFSTHLIFGAYPENSSTGENYNSALYMTPDGKVQGKYDKAKLLLMGEYIPTYLDYPFISKLFSRNKLKTAGSGAKVFRYKDFNLAPLICYDDLFPSYFSKFFPLKPNLIVNITDDSLFGTASVHHMLFSLYRSIEMRLDFVKASNNGPSVFVDATGKILKQTKAIDLAKVPTQKPIALISELSLMEPEETIYVKYGNWLPYLCTFFILGLLTWILLLGLGLRVIKRVVRIIS